MESNRATAAIQTGGRDRQTEMGMPREPGEAPSRMERRMHWTRSPDQGAMGHWVEGMWALKREVRKVDQAVVGLTEAWRCKMSVTQNC